MGAPRPAGILAPLAGLALAWAGASSAQDAPTEEGPGAFDGLDIEIDLSGPGAEALTYTGGNSQKAQTPIQAAAAVTVAAPVGNVIVRCTATEALEARIDFKLSGTQEAALAAYGDNLALGVSSQGATGSVKLVAPRASAAVTQIDATLTVNAPKMAKLNISASGGYIQVSGCDGAVTASAARGGAVVEGDLKTFQVQAAQGDVRVVLSGAKGPVAASGISAPGGSAALVLPAASDVTLDAKGASVEVTHHLLGELRDTSATGMIGAGGTKVTIQAKGAVSVK